jgi:hypothetical protein
MTFALGACGGSPDVLPDAAVSGGAIQMNDVSILFPLTAPAASVGNFLSGSDSGARGTLLPSKLYDAVGHISGSSGNPPPGGTGNAAYGDLHVVAIRIDPCFAALAPDPHGAGCTSELRVVFQELTTVEGKVTAFDSGLHAFYKLSRADLDTLTAAIGALRASNSTGERLGGLAPHPIIASQGLDGAMADGIRKLVLAYAGEQNLTRVTELSATNTGFDWTFTGFDVSDAAGASFTPMMIPTLSDATSQLFFRGFNTTTEGEFMPPTSGSDDLQPLANGSAAMQLTPSARQAAFDGLVRVDNPTDNSPNTTDCASCHLATPVSQLVAQPLFGMVEAQNPNAFKPDGVYVLASETAPRFDATGSFNVHAFSYVGTDPGINQRTVNETAAIVAYLNANAGD